MATHAFGACEQRLQQAAPQPLLLFIWIHSHHADLKLFCYYATADQANQLIWFLNAPIAKAKIAF